MPSGQGQDPALLGFTQYRFRSLAERLQLSHIDQEATFAVLAESLRDTYICNVALAA
jgi:hypothetical protein